MFSHHHRLSLVAALLVAVAASTEAFQAQTSPAASINNLSARNSFFGFGEQKTENSASSPSNNNNNNGLIEQAKRFLYDESGFYSPSKEDILSDDFIFRGPYVGPLNKKDYLQTMDTFGIHKALPDINPNAWGFSIDPTNPNRVWFMVRNTGTFTGEPIAPDTINFKPNGAKLEGCPETFSIVFDENDNTKIKLLTVGYVADRFEGNTNGKGAAIGIFNVIGLPFPPVGPLQRFAQWFGTEVIDVGAKSYSKKEDLPAWWTSDAFGADGYM